jgi:hypothetical protein
VNSNSRPILGFSLADQSLQHSKSIGILNVSLGLLSALAGRPELARIVAFSNASLTLPPGVEVESYDGVMKSRMARIAWDQFGVYSAARRAGCDWLLLLKGFTSFLARPRMKLAVYVHDAMHDFYRSRYPACFGGFEQRYFERGYEATLRRADLVLTNSGFTASEVKRMAEKRGVRPPRTVVAGIGFEAVPVRGPKENAIVVLVSVWPHKLTARAIEWLSRWQEGSGYSGEVRLIGSLPPATAVPGFRNWRHFSRLETAAFEEAVSRCRALVYFSEYEGFGMPPIEAIIRGTAPVYSRIPAMMETSGDRGFPFANEDYSSFAAGLNAALNCPTGQIDAWSKQLLERHHWKAVAERVAGALAKV